MTQLLCGEALNAMGCLRSWSCMYEDERFGRSAIDGRQLGGKVVYTAAQAASRAITVEDATRVGTT